MPTFIIYDFSQVLNGPHESKYYLNVLKGWVENNCGYTNWDVLNNLYSATWIILCMPGTI